jgi:hypothetical protein
MEGIVDPELAYHPLEHILEVISCRCLGKAIGVGHDTAARIKRLEHQMEPMQEKALFKYVQSGGLLNNSHVKSEERSS